MSEKEFKSICEIDNIAEQYGGYVDSTNDVESEVHYDYRAIIAYCREKKMQPIDMTIREMQQFVLG